MQALIRPRFTDGLKRTAARQVCPPLSRSLRPARLCNPSFTLRRKMPRPHLARKGKRQRFYARNAIKTTLDWSTVRRCSGRFEHLMRPFWATPANSYPTSIHPALNGFAAECAATLMRLMAYVGVLGLLAMAGLHFWDELPDAAPPEPIAKAGWSLASRSHPAFAA